MEAGEIDYNIVFPDSTSSDRHWHGATEPVVVLLGWAGSKDKYLSKYSSIYSEQGCVTIRYTAPLKTVFISESFGYKELRCAALKLLEILYDYEVEHCPIFFHVFSNGGFMLYRYIIELLDHNQQFKSLRVVGAILDSAPGKAYLQGALRALNTTLGPRVSPLIRFILLTLFAVTIFLVRVLLYPITRFVHKHHYDAVRDSPPPWPQLHLYSRADKVIRHTDIEGFMKTVRKKGFSVDGFDFLTSQHVSHFRAFPQQYTHKCRSFLHACMKNFAKSKEKMDIPRDKGMIQKIK